MNVINQDLLAFIEEAKVYMSENTDCRTYTRKDLSTSASEGDFMAIRWGQHERAICAVRLDCCFEPIIFGDCIDTVKEA